MLGSRPNADPLTLDHLAPSDMTSDTPSECYEFSDIPDDFSGALSSTHGSPEPTGPQNQDRPCQGPRTPTHPLERTP